MVDDKKMLKTEIIGLIFIIVLGFIWHDLYKITDNNFLVGFFAPVNESMWEHFKIVFWPVIVWSIVAYFLYDKEVNNYIFARIASIMLFQLVTFGLSQIAGNFFEKTPLWVHISTYILGAMIGQWIAYRIMKSDKKYRVLTLIALLLVLEEMFLLFKFTVNPPRLPYFKDSQTNTYGIYQEIN